MTERLSLLALLFAGCQSAGGLGATHAANGALNGAIAGGASASSRAQGGCYAVCPVGTACNAQTGFCDELPCRSQCAWDEECDTRGLVPHCVQCTRSPLEIHTAPGAAPPAPPSASAPTL